MAETKRLPNGLTPEQDAAFARLAQAWADHLRGPTPAPDADSEAGK